MNVDFLIIGQGICGTWLSYYLLKENKTIAVIDKKNDESASNVAGGLINPVTGRRVVTTWMAEELMPFVWNEYKEVSSILHSNFISQKNVLVFPTAPDLHNAFKVRMDEHNSYIKPLTVEKDLLREHFNFPFDVFEISPCYVVAMHELLSNYREYLQVKNILIEEVFDETQLVHRDDFVEYKNIKAKKIIYANGTQATTSQYWMNLPFVQNKGQALIIELDDLPTSHTYKFGHLTLIPLQKNLWWVGSSNELSFETSAPTDDFKNKTIASLESILKRDFIVKEHLSALRPATVERRPFVGLHPLFKNIGILNGMGSKGCSLAPWFAKELAGNLIYENPIDSSADIKRFSRLLGRN